MAATSTASVVQGSSAAARRTVPRGVAYHTSPLAAVEYYRVL